MLTSNQLNRIYYYAKKLKSINHLGGKCVNCGETEQFKLTFHHMIPNEKEYKVSDLFCKSWDVVKKEIEKCELLCFNCHMEKHYGQKDRKNKKILLDFKGQLSCEICGYNKCLAAIDFHHSDPNEKEFKLSSVMKIDNILLLKDEIENELNKCVVLCKNCHQYHHSNINFFNENKDLIYDKINNLRYKQSKIDRDIIKSMYDTGMSISEISKKLNASKSTISLIVKNFTLY